MKSMNKEKDKILVILEYLKQLFPNAKCELVHKDLYELLIDVILSAQTTDAAVNKVTPALFEKYPDVYSLSKAQLSDVENCIKKIGLYKNKAKNIILCAKKIVDEYDGEIPSSINQLVRLPGVGRKTANVVRAVWFKIPSIPVDTHVERISKRLGLAKFNDDVLTVEKKLKRKIPRDKWNESHHLMIFFGRYKCKSKNPECNNCLLKKYCKKDKYEEYKKS